MTFLKLILERPLLRVILAIAGLSSAALVGALGELGVRYLPVIDQASMFIVIAAFVSALALATNLTAFVIGALSQTVKAGLAYWLRREPRAWSSWTITIMAAAVVVWANVSAILNEPIDWENTRGLLWDNAHIPVAPILFTAGLTLAGWIGLKFVAKGQAQAVEALKWAGILAWMFVLLVSANGIGASIVDHARRAPPVLRVDLSDPTESMEVRIAANATEGLIVFADRSQQASYIPLRRIVRMTSIASVDRLDGEGEVAVLGK